MKALIWHAAGDIRLEDVSDPQIQDPTDAIVRITTSAICGTDLHLVRGTMPPMTEGTVLGHEGVGVVEELGAGVSNLAKGDRVVIPSSVACGFCHYCRQGLTAQCDTTNPNGPRAGSVWYGGTSNSGPFNGLQAEKARIPYANFNLVELPDDISDEQAILISDIFPTGYFGADIANIEQGNTVAVFGCGPVGLFAIVSARLLGAGRIFAVDAVPARLEQARRLGAEVIDYNASDPVEQLLDMTGGIGVDRTIEAVGVDAYVPTAGPAARKSEQSGEKSELEQESERFFGKTRVQGDTWHPGNAPSQSLRWCAEALAKNGTLSIIGAFPIHVSSFPIGLVFNRNLTVRAGIVHHRMYIPRLIELVRSGVVDPIAVIGPEHERLDDIESAYKTFDAHGRGWTKVELSV